MSSSKEIELLVQALRLNTLSKLTFADSKRFDALILDVFPGAEFKNVKQETLVEALKQAIQELNLEIVESQVKKSWLKLFIELRILKTFLNTKISG